MNVYDILIVNSSDNPSHYSHYCHPVVIKKVRPLCSASLSSQLFTKQFIFSYKIIFLSSPTGREGIVCTEILLLNDQFSQKETFFTNIFNFCERTVSSFDYKSRKYILCIKGETAAIFFKTKLDKQMLADKKYFGNQNPGRVFTDIRWNLIVSYSEEKYWCSGRDKHLKNLCLAVISIV